MSRITFATVQSLGFLFLLVLSSHPTLAQQGLIALSRGSEVDRVGVSRVIVDSGPPPMPANSSRIIAEFVKSETQVREALNQHTFKRDVILQTIGLDGQVTGQYIRNSRFVFDDKGNRIEHVLYHPPSTIREMRITKEDIKDLAGAQLLGIDITEAGKYRLYYVGTDKIDSREVFAIDVIPAQPPNPHRMAERFFVGRVWVDANNFQIVRVKGTVEPQGKQRFPIFETSRETVTASLLLPTRTQTDDVLRFPDRSVHYRINVRYYDYKRFASQVKITEIDEPATR